MRPSHLASRRAAPIFDPAAARSEAASACALAGYYTRKGNYPAAARKCAQALAVLRQLAQFERASPCTGCPDNFPLPQGPLDFFDQRVVQDFIRRRTACDLCPAGSKPCLVQKGGAK